MATAVCPKIRSAPRIVRPEALHAVGDRVPTWRRAIARSVIAGRHRSIIGARIIRIINADDDFDRVGLAHVEGSPEVRT
jgi:hypothetical protein